jgi:hypothetical protein
MNTNPAQRFAVSHIIIENSSTAKNIIVCTFEFTCLYFAIKYTKYAYVKETIFMFNGITVIRSSAVLLTEYSRLLHVFLTSSGVSYLYAEFILNIESVITTIMQFTSKSPRKITPRISDFKMEVNTKKDTIIKGIMRNPTYSNGLKSI